MKPHALVPDRFLYAPAGHVSEPGSPGRGTVWNAHSILPVRASHPRTSPYSRPVAGVFSPLVPPVITTFRYTAGGDGMPNAPTPPSTLTLAFKSTTPLTPNSV